MRAIMIHTIPHDQQRWDTVGDWQVGGTSAVISTSDLGSPDAEFLCALHELVEMWLCLKHGVTQEAVDAWDQAWEPDADNPDEPGCDPRAPYHTEHEAAEVVERVACAVLGLDWHAYNKVYDQL